ncbi:MAG TPA: Gfo/Idh/MocA family oxidoreductase, partial [Blastocatellia bacterium]
MNSSEKTSRREFMKLAAATTIITGASKTILGSGHNQEQAQKISPNEKIRLATIGIGGQGTGDTTTALRVPGVELVAAADVYDGRLTRAKEVFGNQVFTTRDYREVLARPDVDAVIIATPDHWHTQISLDAMGAGKDVYCEKPMIHSL